MNIFNKNRRQDNLSFSMQDEIIKIASLRLGEPLSEDLISNIRQDKWSYMGLEMMIDTVNSIDVSEIKRYLSNLG